MRFRIVALFCLLTGAYASISPAPHRVPSRQASRLEQVVVVFKTHLDIGYTDLAENVIRRYRTEMIDHALATMDEARALPPERQFQWMMAGWPVRQMLWPGQEREWAFARPMLLWSASKSPGSGSTPTILCRTGQTCS